MNMKKYIKENLFGIIAWLGLAGMLTSAIWGFIITINCTDPNSIETKELVYPSLSATISFLVTATGIMGYASRNR